MRQAIVIGLLLTCLAAALPVSGADVPDYYVAIVSQASEPVSVYASPGDSGRPLGESFGQGGMYTVDATITIQLLNNGEPVAGFPMEDIWLEGGWTSLPDVPFHPCPACGSCADAPTDMNGITTFSGPLSGGGAGVDPSERNLVIFVAGEIPPQDPLVGYRITSADLNGDLVVDLNDLSLFAQAYNTHDEAADFNWDGYVGLMDLVLFSGSYGESCSQIPTR